MTDHPDLQKIAADILSGKIDVARANEGLTATESEQLAELLTAEAERLEAEAQMDGRLGRTRAGPRVVREYAEGRDQRCMVFDLS
jgi:hypothetical protein